MFIMIIKWVYLPLLIIYILALLLSGKASFGYRNIAILLALFLGGFGVHKFFLGRYKTGVIYLCFSFTFIPFILGFIDFVVLLLMSDKQFETKYLQTEQENNPKIIKHSRKYEREKLFFSTPAGQRAEKPARLWKRFLAAAVDITVILFFYLFLFLIMEAVADKFAFIRANLGFLNFIVFCFIYYFYFFFLENNLNTLGKMIMGIEALINQIKLESRRTFDRIQLLLILSYLPFVGCIIRVILLKKHNLRAVVDTVKKRNTILRAVLRSLLLLIPTLLVIWLVFAVVIIIYTVSTTERFPSKAINRNTEKIINHQKLSDEQKTALLSLEDIVARIEKFERKNNALPSTLEDLGITSNKVIFSKYYKDLINSGAVLNINNRHNPEIIFYSDNKTISFIIERQRNPRKFSCKITGPAYDDLCKNWGLKAEFVEYKK